MGYNCDFMIFVRAHLNNNKKNYIKKKFKIEWGTCAFATDYDDPCPYGPYPRSKGEKPTRNLILNRVVSDLNVLFSTFGFWK